MTTLADLQVQVSREMRDPNNQTFTTALLTDYLNAGIADISRMAPRQFQEDIEPDGSLSYALLTTADPRIRLVRVEIWDVAPNTVRMLIAIPSAASSLWSQTEAGWRVWNGNLELPYTYAAYLADDTRNLRVWGWSPYTKLVASDDDTDLDEGLQEAVVEYAIYRAYEALANDRSLFQQWQINANATDVSVAAILGAMDRFAQRWERRRRQLFELRELPD
jgi:hypothetical protein